MNTAEAFLRSLRASDFSALRELLASDVWCRAMLVREVVEVHTASETVDLFESWFGAPTGIEMDSAEHHQVTNRTFVRYSVRLRPDWAPETWHRVEQAGYLTVAGDQIRRVDLACTGFHPLPNRGQ